MSGIGGEICEMDELLAIIKDERNILVRERKSRRGMETRTEIEKEKLGAVIGARATERSSNEDKYSSVNELDNGERSSRELSPTGDSKGRRKRAAI